MTKAISLFRWAFTMLLPALGFVIAPILYPMAYWLRNINWVRYKKPFWYFFDDEDGLYGAKYWRKEKKITKYDLWTSYRWSALRNPMWNLQASIIPIEGDEAIISIKGKLTKNGNEVPATEVATMFFVNEKGVFTNNVGKYLSLKYSIIGRMFLWFKINDRLYFRFSLVRNIIGKIWLEIHFGTTYRHTFRMKLKKVNIYENINK